MPTDSVVPVPSDGWSLSEDASPMDWKKLIATKITSLGGAFQWLEERFATGAAPEAACGASQQ